MTATLVRKSLATLIREAAALKGLMIEADVIDGRLMFRATAAEGAALLTRWLTPGDMAEWLGVSWA